MVQLGQSEAGTHLSSTAGARERCVPSWHGSHVHECPGRRGGHVDDCRCRRIEVLVHDRPGHGNAPLENAPGPRARICLDPYHRKSLDHGLCLGRRHDRVRGPGHQIHHDMTRAQKVDPSLKNQLTKGRLSSRAVLFLRRRLVAHLGDRESPYQVAICHGGMGGDLESCRGPCHANPARAPYCARHGMSNRACP